MRSIFATTVVLCAAIMTGCLAGCSLQQPKLFQAANGSGAAAQTSIGTESGVSEPPAAAHPLPFKGRLVSGDPNELPPDVAASLSDASKITFSYREELTHNDYRIPLIFTALDPVTYLGAPLGDIGVSAFGQLTITDGDQVIGDYAARAFVSRQYSMYSEPTHREVEQAARAAVRAKIDSKLAADSARLRAAAGSLNAAHAAMER